MKLIINGDDFGISRACNLGIIDCFNHGVLTSTSIMINMPHAEDAIKLWEANPKLSVGLHLNITLGYPVNKKTKSILKEDGTFNKAILNDSSNQINLVEIAQECQAQVDRFIQLTGKIPDHINSHHGIEAIYGGSQIIQELANRYDLPIRQLTFVNKNECFKEIIHRTMPIQKMLTVPSSNIADTINLFSQEELNSDGYFELIGHPGYIDYELTQLSSLTIGRCVDINCFCAEELKNWIKQNHIELISYKDLPKKY